METQPKETGINHQLEQNSQFALERLGTYLDTPQERVLRAHQVDVMESLRNHLKMEKHQGILTCLREQVKLTSLQKLGMFLV